MGGPPGVAYTNPSLLHRTLYHHALIELYSRMIAKRTEIVLLVIIYKEARKKEKEEEK